MDYPRQDVFPFIVGSGRSGTTLLQAILSTHPDLAIVHESQFISRVRSRPRWTRTSFDVDAAVDAITRSPDFRRMNVPVHAVRAELADRATTDFGDLVRAIFRVFASERGKSRYGDKTPGYVLHIDTLARLLPESRFIHVVRDGRDVALSYLATQFGPATIPDGALYWKRRVSRGRASGERLGPERYMEIQYEVLVRDPEAVVRSVCRFIAIDYDDRMLRFHEDGARVRSETADPSAHQNLMRPITVPEQGWQDRLSPAEVAIFDALAGGTMERFGYPRPEMDGRRPIWAATRAWSWWHLQRVRAAARKQIVGTRRRQRRGGPTASGRSRRQT
jgi:hypothetical protein